MIYDYKCKQCGNEEKDVLVKDRDEIILCKICNTSMERQMCAFSFKFTPPGVTTHRHKIGNNLPDNYKFSGGANFGKLKS